MRDTLSTLDIKFSEIKGAACCLPPALFGFNKDVWLKMNLRNFSLADGDLLTICDECFASLQDTKITAETEGGKILPNVFPLVKVLKDAEEKLRENVKSLNLKCAIQHSCHLLRPSKIRRIDDPESPKIVRSLLDILGCKDVGQVDELGCCGGSIYVDSKISKNLAIRRIRSAKNFGADLIVTTCPHCLKHLRVYSKNLPVLHLVQLCALALGSDPSEIGTRGVLI
jgi:heterodisulfide reductase subunit B